MVDAMYQGIHQVLNFFLNLELYHCFNLIAFYRYLSCLYALSLILKAIFVQIFVHFFRFYNLLEYNFSMYVLHTI